VELRVGESFLPSRPGQRAYSGKPTDTAEALRTCESLAYRIVTCCRLLLHHFGCSALVRRLIKTPNFHSLPPATSGQTSHMSDDFSYGDTHYNKFLALALPASRSSGGVSNSASLLGTLDPGSFLETCQVIVCMMMFS
jgi:hypothetical protein